MMEPVARIDADALKELEKHPGASATVWSGKARNQFAKGAVPLVRLSDADARIAELEEEIGRLEDENSDLRCEPWPEWARSVLKVIRKHSGYDGYDDATEGVDMPLELSEHLSEMDAEVARWKARAEEAEIQISEIAGHLDSECDSDSILHIIGEAQADRDIYKERAEATEALLKEAGSIIKRAQQNTPEHFSNWHEAARAIHDKIGVKDE